MRNTPDAENAIDRLSDKTGKTSTGIVMIAGKRIGKNVLCGFLGMFDFFKKGPQQIPCPICHGRGQVLVDHLLERCFWCGGHGWSIETSERTDE